MKTAELVDQVSLAAIAREAFGTKVHSLVAGEARSTEYAALIRCLGHVMHVEYGGADWLRAFRNLDAVITTYAGWHRARIAEPFLWYGVEPYVTRALLAVADRLGNAPVKLMK